MKSMRGTAAIVIVATAATASANQIELGANRSAVIANESGEVRLLVAFPDLAMQLADQWVTNATMTLPLGSTALPSDVEVAVEAIATSWGSQPTWTSPWTTPGGDLEETLGASGEIPAGQSPDVLTVDVTDIVRAIVEGEMQDRGMMLLPGLDVVAGFSSAQAALLGGGLSQATLRVYYRDLTALGYEGGMKALLARRRSAIAEGDRR